MTYISPKNTATREDQEADGETSTKITDPRHLVVASSAEVRSIMIMKRKRPLNNKTAYLIYIPITQKKAPKLCKVVTITYLRTAAL